MSASLSSISHRAAKGKSVEAISEPVPHDLIAGVLELEKLSIEERLVFSEIARALKAMRYGSILLTVHDGHLVELSKTVRLRTKPLK
jgi:hypothetical protein